MAAPPGLTEAARTELAPGTRTLVHQPWGSWFEFALPDLPVFVDSRIEIIPSDIWHDYGQVGFSGAEWQEVLDRWDVQAIVAAADWDLLPVLEAPGSGWRLVYQDDDGALFVRAVASRTHRRSRGRTEPPGARPPADSPRRACRRCDRGAS